MGLISSYSDDAATTDNDRFITYAADGTTKNTPASNINKYMGDGWIISGDTWTFSSYNSTTKIGVINTNSGANTKYQPGMWVRFVQPTLGTKYARIISTTTSTITVKFYDASILSNEAITSPVFSGARAPFGANQAATVESSELNFGGSGAGIWWEEVGRYTYTTAGTNVGSVTVPVRKYYKVLATFEQTSSASTWIVITINNDTGLSSYHQRAGNVQSTSSISGENADKSNCAEALTFASVASGGIMTVELSQTASSSTWYFLNQCTTDNFWKSSGGRWLGTSQITSFQLNPQGATLKAGSEIVVLGHN